MSNVEKQKEVANRVLKKVRFVSPFAVVAGGAPRDWFCGRIAKDIDIYMNWLSGEDLDIVKFQMEQVLGFSLKRIGKNNPNYLYDPNLLQVLEGEFENETFQFMLIKTLRVDVSNFALSVSQAWWDGSVIFTTKDFDVSFEKGIVFQTGAFYANSDEYLVKILSKFPELQFIGVYKK